MSLPNLAGVIPAFGTGTYAVTRRGPGTYVDGVHVPASPPTVVNIDLSVHRVGGRDLERLPEGSRGRETIKVFATQALYTADATHAADVIAAYGYTWEVTGVVDWGSQGGGYWRAFASKVEP